MDCVASSSPLLGITSAALTLVVLIYREILRQRGARVATHSKLDALAEGVARITSELEHPPDNPAAPAP